MDYRSSELSKITGESNMGNVTNVNLTMINGGVQTNVVPAYIKLVFDIRLAVGLDQDGFLAMVRKTTTLVMAHHFSLYFEFVLKDQSMVRRGGRRYNNYAYFERSDSTTFDY